MSIDDYKVPENTGYQVELKNKLKIFINKTKYFIFDVYMNHYVQFIYLLFAINIYKTTESYFKLNAEQQKQLSVMDKTDNILKLTNQMQDSDSINFQKTKDSMNSLIEKIGDISKYNKPTQNEINQLKTLDDKAVKKGGSITTVADSVFEDIIAKHNQFFEIYKDTRDAMPDYFNNINELVMNKINYLQDLSNSIMTLQPEHFDIIKRTQQEVAKLSNQPELNKNYKINNNPLVKQLRDDLEVSINSTNQYAQTLQQENQNMINTVSTAPVTSSPTMSVPSATSTTSNPFSTTSGGFVRAGTLFPKNNYKKSKFPLKQK
jgi:acetyl/propionyl-CoA carboxylase alpha subunit